MSGSGSSAQFETVAHSKRVAGVDITVSRNTRAVSQPAAPERSGQFGDRYDHGPETPWRDESIPGETRYKVTAPKSDEPFLVPGASVEVNHPWTAYVERDPDPTPVNTHGDLVRHQHGDGPGGQASLFGVQHHHPYVAYMESHRQFGAHIPTLLSVAALETKQRFGEPLRSDKSLSERASSMVHRLAEAGVTQAPKNEVRNPLKPKSDLETASRRMVGKTSEVPESTVVAAKHQLRQALRRPKQAVARGAVKAGEKKVPKQERMF
jgi:hypothetical protein